MLHEWVCDLSFVSSNVKILLLNETDELTNKRPFCPRVHISLYFSAQTENRERWCHQVYICACAKSHFMIYETPTTLH